MSDEDLDRAKKKAALMKRNRDLYESTYAYLPADERDLLMGLMETLNNRLVEMELDDRPMGEMLAVSVAEGLRHRKINQDYIASKN